VLGGKVHEFVVDLFGVFACQFGVSADCSGADFGQATRFTHAVAFGDVFHDGNDLVFRQPGIEKDGACVLGELFFAMQTPEQPGVVFTILGTNADISFASNAVFRTVFILTTKVFEIVHDTPP
jgi:hypothetical protein